MKKVKKKQVLSSNFILTECFCWFSRLYSTRFHTTWKQVYFGIGWLSTVCGRKLRLFLDTFAIYRISADVFIAVFPSLYRMSSKTAVIRLKILPPFRSCFFVTNLFKNIVFQWIQSLHTLIIFQNIVNRAGSCVGCWNRLDFIVISVVVILFDIRRRCCRNVFTQLTKRRSIRTWNGRRRVVEDKTSSLTP